MVPSARSAASVKCNFIPGKKVKLLVRPKHRVRNFKAKVDTLADQLKNLSFMLKKSQAMISGEHVVDKPIGYSYNKRV